MPGFTSKSEFEAGGRKMSHNECMQGLWYHLHLLASYSDKNTGVLIPIQQRILSVLRLRFFHISPPPQKLLVRRNPRELACDCSVHKFHNTEICGKQDVKIPLMYLLSLANFKRRDG